MKTAIARFHNVYGPHGTWDGGREKAPAAICRKVIEAKDTGKRRRSRSGATARQTRSFMYIDDCMQGHRHDHALRRADRHADQPRLERAGLDQRAGEQGRGDRRREAARATTTSTPPRAWPAATATTPFIKQRPGLGAEHAASTTAWPRPTPGSSSSTRTARPASGRRSSVIVQQAADITDVIGAIPYRMALAGGWIDQPFVSRLNPTPPGSMVVVGLEPTFRFMDRCRHGHRHAASRHASSGTAGCPTATGRAGARALRRGEPGQGRAFRLAGHDRPDLPGRQPAGLRRPS